MVKYLNDCIPVGKLVHKYDIKYPASCPTCNVPVEDRAHLISCPHPTRAAWRLSCYSNMKKTLEDLDTPDPVKALFLIGLRTTLHGRSTTTIDPPPEVQGIAEAQQKIGWHHILKGRLSKKWDEAVQRQPNKAKQQWSSKVIGAVFAEWWKLWEMRNDDRHGRDNAEQQQKEQAQTERETTQLYEAHDGKITRDLQWLFDTPLLTRVTLQQKQLRQWLTTWIPVIEMSYQTAMVTG